MPAGSGLGGAIGVWNTDRWKGIMDPITIATGVCLGTNGSQAIHDGNFGAFDMDVSTGNDITTSGQYALPPSLFGRQARVALYNASGALVALCATDRDAMVSVDTRSLARGMYLVRVSSATGVFAGKVLLDR